MSLRYWTSRPPSERDTRRGTLLIWLAGAAAQARMLADGALTAPMLLEVYLQRIERLDSHPRAYRVVQFDRARAESRPLSNASTPVSGCCSWACRSPSKMMSTSPGGDDIRQRRARPAATSDAEVRRLRAAGAVIIGKTNTLERDRALHRVAGSGPPEGGASSNPWRQQRGSAAAVAAGLAPVALGSDGGGSIRNPVPGAVCFGRKTTARSGFLEPHDGAWQAERQWPDAVGNGRGVATDATTTVPGPEGEFVVAAARQPGRLRIALSTRVPTLLPARCGSKNRHCGSCYVIWATTSSSAIPIRFTHANYPPRFFRGIATIATRRAPDRLEARTELS